MNRYEDWEEVAKALVALTDENAILKKQRAEDADTIRSLRSEITVLKGQIEAFKFCISHGGRR
jgi:hypothetical protein